MTSDARLDAEMLRSITCVAPIDLRFSACLREAVVMMGENPESFASWIAGRLMLITVNFFSQEFMSQLTILANGAGSTDDKNRHSSVFSFAFGRYRWNQSSSSWIFIVKTDIRCREGGRQSRSLIVRNVGRNLTKGMSNSSGKEWSLFTFATVDAMATAYC